MSMDGGVIMIGKSKQKRVSGGQNSKLCMLDTTEYLAGNPAAVRL